MSSFNCILKPTCTTWRKVLLFVPGMLLWSLTAALDQKYCSGWCPHPLKTAHLLLACLTPRVLSNSSNVQNLQRTRTCFACLHGLSSTFGLCTYLQEWLACLQATKKHAACLPVCAHVQTATFNKQMQAQHKMHFLQILPSLGPEKYQAKVVKEVLASKRPLPILKAERSLPFELKCTTSDFRGCAF